MEEDYINMEMDSSFASIFNHSNNKEFEFQSFSTYDHHHDHNHYTTTTSPADELFYMGKLLPLHLPPRLEMVEKILTMHTYNNSNNNSFHQTKPNDNFEEEHFTTPLSSTTPYQSCNISPVESCQVSRELNPHEYFVECSTTMPCKETKKKSWTRKMIKQSSSIGSKLKWGYFKSFFNKSGCTAVDHHQHYCSSIAPAPKSVPPAPFGQIKYDHKVALCTNCVNKDYSHRRSFSGAFRTLSKPYKKSSSSCCDSSLKNSSNNVSVQVLRRSSSAVSSELESPIQAAITHCKRSHHDQQQQYLIVFKKDC